ncbi:MAG: winged helix-turn-helix transcriptional regulator, partial [Eggerthellaceae bacterium]|nr:winged helix-turn-helix transcriptional regulator [Eggerthellaceae bacterium]
MHLDESSPIPYYQQIYDHFHLGIVEGSYPAGGKLPSIRGLADELRCSRNTVEAAYQMLVQEGYVASKPGSGYVIQNINHLDDLAS